MLKRLHIQLVCTCLAAFIALAANATADRPSGSGQVVVDAPKELVKRNNNNANKSKQEQQAKPQQQQQQQQAKPQQQQQQQAATPSQQTTAPKENTTVNNANSQRIQRDPTVQKPKRSYTSQQSIEGHGVGFRIQAYSDNSSKTGKAEVQKRAREISSKFPQYRSYISYKAPSWRLRIGDFKTKEEAQAALRRIKSSYPQFARGMVIVKDHINVWSQ